MTRTVSFTLMEEAIHHMEETLGSWNVQIEVETTEHLDLERLRAAARATATAHPLARARRRHSSAADLGYVWEVPESADAAPVEATEASLPRSQTTFYGTGFDITQDLPFRVLVVREAGVDGGDRLLVCGNHVAVDGVGTLRVARSLCQAYRGDGPDDDPVTLEESRRVLKKSAPSSVEGQSGMLEYATHFLGNTVEPPARIARDTDADEEGWGFVHRRLDDGLSERVVADRPDGASVNDVLLAALHLAVEEWNEAHGKPAGKVSVMMPVNLRPDGWFYDVVGMYASYRSITTHERDRHDPTTALEVIADQTAELKTPDKAAAPYGVLKMLPPGLPVGLKQQLPELLRGPGNRLLDTAVLSNLGRIPDPPTVSGEAEPVWFSPPSIGSGAVGVGIGVATVGDTIHLVFRHTFEQFDPAAGERFADTYREQLDGIVA